MKALTFSICLLFMSIITLAQPSSPEDLKLQLESVEGFYEVKSTIHDYYKNLIINASDDTLKRGYERALKKWNRVFWWNEHFLDESGKIYDYNKNVREALDYRKRDKTTNSRYQINPWQQDGPTHNTDAIDGIGRFDIVAFHPTNANIIFAGSNSGGVFKTINGGLTWAPLSDYLPSLGVAAIVIHPTNPNIMYVLSGDRNTCSNCLVAEYGYLTKSNGVFRSTDGGSSWTHMPEINNQNYTNRDLIMDPNNPSILFLATNEFIYKTEDGCNTWTQISGIIDNIWEMEFKPGSSDTIYAVSDRKLYRSINGGATFVERYHIPTSQRISMAVTPDNPEVVMLLAGYNTGSTGYLAGVFKSTNSGGTFTNIYSGANGDLFRSYLGSSNVSASLVIYNNTLAINPLNENEVVAGGVCIWKSTNGGSSWTQKTAYWPGDANYAHPDQHHIAYNFDGKVYVANDGGVYVSSNGFNTWSFIENGLSATQFYHFEVANDDGDTWGGTQDNGILERDNLNGGFYAFDTGDGYDVLTDHPHNASDGESDDIYYTVNSSIYKDCSGSICNISRPNNLYFFGNLAMDPTDENHLFVGYDDGVAESENAGDDWIVNTQLPANWCVSSCKSDSDRLYFAGSIGNATLTRYTVSTSTEVSLTAALTSAGYTGIKITDIEVSPTNSNNVYVCCASSVAGAKVFFSSDGGASWTNISYNLPNVPVFSLVRDPSAGVYAGTFLGVYYKRSGVNYWEPFYNGLPAVPVTEMELYNYVNGTPQNIMISTFGRGIWKTNTYISACPNQLTLTGDVEGLYYKDATQSIVSTQVIDHSFGTKVRYNAGTEINLTPGFHAKGPGEFKTYLLGCGEEID